jgi:WD40 repeat protein/DNA-binding SARP family transcriptional activator
MDFRILGPLVVSGIPAAPPLRQAKPRAVLAMLVLNANEPVTVDRLAIAVWGDDVPADAARTVRVYISRLRKALGDPDRIERTPAGYRLRVAPGELDVERFETAMAEGRRLLAAGQPQQASERLAGALAIWRGPPLPELEGVARAETARLEEQRLATQEARAEALLALGDHADAITALTRLRVEHPTRERPAALLMLALYRSGRQVQALEVYQDVRRSLVEEAGLEPGPALQQVQRDVLAQAESHEREAAPQPPLAGREAELEQLRAHWDAARAGHGRVVALVGPAGIGKTRLAAELAHEVRVSGYAVGDLDGAVVRPTLVVLDGAGPSEDIGHLPLLVIACTRGSPSPGALDTIELGPLGAEAVQEIAAGVPTGWLLAASGGVPRRVHEQARLWLQRKAERRTSAAAMRTAAERTGLRAAEAELTGSLVELEAASVPLSPDESETLCPYKGLAAFEVDDAPYFFGRERLVAELVTRLVGARALGVVGPSGSGKSSVVRAGLLPALARGVLPGSAGWPQAIIRPGEHPLDALERAATGERTLLAVDQFEETFTVCGDEREREAFVAGLLDGPQIVVLAIRADCYGRCATYPRLANLLAAHHVLVSPMRRDEYHRAVEAPAARAGLTLEPGLTEALVADVEREPGALPLLSTALLELWQRRDGRRLRLATYEDTGGVRGAVARHAEEAFARLNPGQQAQARAVLLRLAAEGVDGGSERRRVPLDEFEDAGTVGALAAERLLTVSEGHVELAHEALLREWPRLRGWLEDDAEGRRLQRRIADAAREWVAGGREPSDLYRGARLAAALEWRGTHEDRLNHVEREFLDDSTAAERRQARRRHQTVAGAIALLTLVAVVSTAIAIRGLQRGRREQRADVSRALATQARAHLDDNVALAGLLGLEAFRIEPTAEARSAALSVLPALTSYHRLGAPLHHGVGLTGVAFSPDGRTLATAADDGVWLWDLKTRRRLDLPLSAHGGEQVLAVAFSHDGRMLASGGADGTARLWNVARRAPASRPLLMHVDGVNGVAFSPDDHMLVAAGGGSEDASVPSRGAARLWSVPSGRPLGPPFKPTVQTIGDVEFSPDGALLAFTGNDTRVRLWDVQARRMAGTPLVAALPLFDVAFSPDGSTLATVGDFGLVRLWDMASRKPLGGPLPGHLGIVRTAAFTPDGRLLATGAEDATVRVWDVVTRRPLQVLTTDTDSRTQADGVGRVAAVRGLAFAPRGRVVAAAGESGDVQVWDLGKGRALSRPLTGHGGWVRGVAFDAEGVPVSGGVDRTLEFGRSRPIRVGEEVLAVTASPDGRTVAVAGNAGLLQLYDARTHRALGRTLRGHTRAVDTVAFDAEGRTLASGGDDGTVRLWDVEHRRALGAPIDLGAGAIHSIAFDPEGLTLAIAAGTGAIRLWDVGHRRPVDPPLQGPVGFTSALAFSPDGSVLASAGGDKTVWLWDTDRHRPLGPPLTGHTDVIEAVAFSRDGRTLATAGDDRTIRLWDVASGQTLGQPLRDHGAGVSALAFDPRHDALASAGQDATVRLWDPALWTRDDDVLRNRVCGAINRDLTHAEWAQFLPGRRYHKTCA